MAKATFKTLAIGAALAATVAATPALAQGPHGMMHASAHGAGDPIFRVDLNKTQIVRLPAKAGSIVVGNPAIADVSIQSADMIFVVGRGYGETNLVILDRQGNTMMDADIQVTAVTPTNGVRVFNGGMRATFNCAPYCQPAPVLGDSPDFIGANTGESGKSGGIGSIFEDLVGNMTDNLTGGASGGSSSSPAGGSQPSGPSSGF